MELLVGILVILLVLSLGLIPGWLLLLCYDYIANSVGIAGIDINFFSVLSVSVILAILRSIFTSTHKG